MIRMAKVFLILFLLLIVPNIFANSLDDAYQEGANLGKLNQEKAAAGILEENYNPAKIFKNYNENPSQTKYYHGITSDSGKDLREAGEAEYKYDEDDSKNNGIQAALKAFRKNPSTPYKIDSNNQNDPIISRAKNIMGNYKEGSDCKESTVCHVEYVKKKCNEQTRAIKRICEKVPHVTTIDDFYPGCQRHTSPGSVEDCLAGHIPIPHYRGSGHGKVVLPKKRGARVGFSDSRHPYYYITIFNEATGQHVGSPHRRVSNGYYIELPTSKTQDQTFSFIVDRWDGCSCHLPGRMRIYINYLRRIPKIEWQEGSCRDI